MKIFLDTIGCRLNQAEIERLARQFRSAGHEIVASAAEADLAVVNTCSVTTQAASDSRAAIRRATRLGAAEVVVTGCWATLEPQKAAQLPRVKTIIPNDQKESLPARVLDLPPELFELEPVARRPLPGAHARTRAFIKVQDGCDNACTFCITTLARGSSRSRPLPAVLEDIRFALAGGVKEIVLTGVQLGSWGQDFEPPMRLSTLLQAILAQTETPRLRLSSLEPWDVDEDLFSLWADPRLCRHLHLPLQSGSAAVLRRMARKITPAAFGELVQTIRRYIPEIALTTDVIAGFPAESDSEFAESEAFIRSIGFAGGHVFTYSARPGTPAARMKGQVPFPLRKERNARLRNLFVQLEQDYQDKFIGQRLSALWESAVPAAGGGFTLTGLTDNYLHVTVNSPLQRWNQLDDVQLNSRNADGLEGTLLPPVTLHEL